jgi:hypothetical protein
MTFAEDHPGEKLRTSEARLVLERMQAQHDPEVGISWPMISDHIAEVLKARAFRYYFLSRPPFIGTHPSGETNRQVWQPVELIPDTERPAHGWVEYSEPLGHYDVWRFELYPADEDELKRYNDWREAEVR